MSCIFVALGGLPANTMIDRGYVGYLPMIILQHIHTGGVVGLNIEARLRTNDSIDNPPKLMFFRMASC